MLETVQTALPAEMETESPEETRKGPVIQTSWNLLQIQLPEKTDLSKSLFLIDGIETDISKLLEGLCLKQGRYELSWSLADENGENLGSGNENIQIQSALDQCVIKDEFGDFSNRLLFEQDRLLISKPEEVTLSMMKDGIWQEATDEMILEPENASYTFIFTDPAGDKKIVTGKTITVSTSNLVTLSRQKLSSKKVILNFDEGTDPDLFIQVGDKSYSIQKNMEIELQEGENVFVLMAQGAKGMFSIPITYEKPIVKPQVIRPNISMQNLPVQGAATSIPSVQTKPVSQRTELIINEKVVNNGEKIEFSSIKDLKFTPGASSFEIRKNGKIQTSQDLKEVLKEVKHNDRIDIKVSDETDGSKQYESTLTYKALKADLKNANTDFSAKLEVNGKVEVKQKKEAREKIDLALLQNFSSVEDKTVKEGETVRILLKKSEAKQNLAFSSLKVNGEEIALDSIQKDEFNQPYYELPLKQEFYQIEATGKDQFGNEVGFSRKINVEMGKRNIFLLLLPPVIAGLLIALSRFIKLRKHA